MLDGGAAYDARRDRKKGERRRRRSNSLVLLHFDDELADIIEEADYEVDSYSHSQSSSSGGEDVEGEESDEENGSCGESERPS